MERVNALLRQEIGQILAEELSDPRLSRMVSVTEVVTAPDLRQARVYVSVMGDAEAKSSTLKALGAASGFVHRSLRGRITLRAVPSLEFRLDESIEQGSEILKLIGDLAPEPEDLEAGSDG